MKFALPLMLAYAALLVWGVVSRVFPWWVLVLSPAVNLLAFITYWLDKSAAEQRKWRIRERTLHAWSLAGGWGGAWWAQQLLRHKSSKRSFRLAYWATALLHVGAIAGALCLLSHR